MGPGTFLHTTTFRRWYRMHRSCTAIALSRPAANAAGYWRYAPWHQ